MVNKRDENLISLWFLFWNFLKIGSYSFGGYMALIAVVRKEFVERKKIISDEEILNGLSLASFIPGPVAVNTVAFVGHSLRGVMGAVVSMAGILLPTFLLVAGFSIYYFQPGTAALIDPHVTFVMPVVVAVILDVGIKMARKQVKKITQGIIAVATLLITMLYGNAVVILSMLIIAGLLGFWLFRERNGKVEASQASGNYFEDLPSLLAVVAATLLLFALLAWIPEGGFSVIFGLASVFSGMSLSLFGGGYVIIPIIENVVVNELTWLTINEFNAAISISQITPGPILISAAFIGYKLAGIPGAIVGTISIFLPSGILMIILSGVHKNVKESRGLKAVLTGLRSAVIGLIATAALSIGLKEIDSVIAAIVFIVSLAGFLFTKIHPALLIIVALLLSFLI